MKITETEMSAALHMGPRGLRGTLRFTRVMGLLQLRYEHDSSTILLRFDYDSATTRYEVFRALAYEIVYENQW